LDVAIQEIILKNCKALFIFYGSLGAGSPNNKFPAAEQNNSQVL
jgi:hypothetical protein